MTADVAGDDWQDAWQEVIDAVGTDFDTGSPRFGADRVDPSSLRRWLEPLEFDCALHYDPEMARRYGHEDVIAPYAATLTYAIGPSWTPGDAPLFVDGDRDAQPARSPISHSDFALGPRTEGFFATDMEFEFVRPLRMGERVATRGRKLVGCVPKQTSVGRGAFLTWESLIVDEAGETVVRVRTGTYAYVPRGPRPPEAS
jgi:hypothetical protein